MSNELVKQDQYLSEFDYAKRVGQMIVKSGKFAKDWNEDTVGILVLYAKDLGIHPVTALINGFDIIQGKISMKPILMANMIRRKGHSVQIVQNDNNVCILKGKRKDTGDECEIKFSIEDAKRAGLADKSSFKSWQSDMLYNRAMGRLGRMLFADVIGGAYTDGEMEDIVASNPKKKKPAEPEEVPMTEIEITDHIQQPAPEEPQVATINDLALALSTIGTTCDSAMLAGFVQLMGVKYKTTDSAIIRSALMSEDQLEKFNASFLASLEEKPKP